jgi:hypothetical protein
MVVKYVVYFDVHYLNLLNDKIIVYDHLDKKEE